MITQPIHFRLPGEKRKPDPNEDRDIEFDDEGMARHGGMYSGFYADEIIDGVGDRTMVFTVCGQGSGRPGTPDHRRFRWGYTTPFSEEGEVSCPQCLVLKDRWLELGMPLIDRHVMLSLAALLHYPMEAQPEFLPGLRTHAKLFTEEQLGELGRIGSEQRLKRQETLEAQLKRELRGEQRPRYWHSRPLWGVVLMPSGTVVFRGSERTMTSWAEAWNKRAVPNPANPTHFDVERLCTNLAHRRSHTALPGPMRLCPSCKEKETGLPF